MLKHLVIGLAGVVTAGIAYQLLGSYADRKRFPPPGRMIDVDGTSLHLSEQGTGRPVVVLEAGIAATSIGWALVQPEIAKVTTVCSYDRTGLGWSESLRRPLTVERATRELATLLEASGLDGPFILVGHSFGGLLIRAFAAYYPNRVSGLVLLDPVSLSAWSDCTELDRKRLAMGAKLSRRGAMLARFGVVRAALALLMAGNKGLSKSIGRTAAGRGSAVLERLVGEVRKLPRKVWPVLQAHWSQPKSFYAMAAYLECLPAFAREVAALPRPANIPMVILSAGNATAQELAERDSLVAGNPNGRHNVLEDAGHWLQFERPDEVVSAVLTLIRNRVEW